ncbi:Gfo/Idh/MocA family protein [Phycisphaerales bacterium AB-hyl4]|uniref:Gfo/Idh/MocA family protein n=1 Tax=Natronomicrosphaera hydrolytica TaxID=3242702 RepID=A0ABV4U6M0_9BACT
MDRIRVGQIGICHEHASAKIQTLKRMSDVFEIVGVVDDRATSSSRRAGDDLSPYEGLTWVTEKQLLSMPGLQAVFIETPNQDLVPTAMRCMQHHLPMHMDKPGGEDLAAFRELLNGCRKHDIALQMGYMFRNNLAMQFATKAVKHNWLGDIFEIQASMSHNYGGEPYQIYLGSYAGGIMFNLGCHLIDTLIPMMGRPDNVTPFLKSAPGYSQNIKNNCLTVLEYPHATVTLRVCSKEVDGLNRRSLKICGTNGTIELSPLERFDGQPLQLRLTLLEGNQEYPAGTHMVDFGVAQDRYENQLLEFARIIRGEMKNPYSYEHDELVQEVLLAASGYTKWER